MTTDSLIGRLEAQYKHKDHTYEHDSAVYSCIEIVRQYLTSIQTPPVSTHPAQQTIQTSPEMVERVAEAIAIEEYGEGARPQDVRDKYPHAKSAIAAIQQFTNTAQAVGGAAGSEAVLQLPPAPAAPTQIDEQGRPMVVPFDGKVDWGNSKMSVNPSKTPVAYLCDNGDTRGLHVREEGDDSEGFPVYLQPSDAPDTGTTDRVSLYKQLREALDDSENLYNEVLSCTGTSDGTWSLVLDRILEAVLPVVQPPKQETEQPVEDRDGA